MAIALDGTGVGTSSATLTTTGGSGLIFCCIWSNSAISTPTAAGLTFTLRKTYTSGFEFANASLYYAPYTSNFSGTITATSAGTTVVCGVTGIASSGAAFDSNAGLPFSNNSSPVSGSTTNANDFIIAMADCTGASTAGSGWSPIGIRASQVAEYQIVSSPQSSLTVTVTTGTAKGTIFDAVMANPGIAFQLGTDVQSSGLAALALANKIVIVSGVAPTSYANAVSNTLGVMAFGIGNCFGAASDNSGPPANMQISSIAVAAGSVTANGTPTGWAVLDDANSRLLAWGPLTGAVAVTIGQSWSLASFTIQVPVQ